jgi:hypothetical protein
MIDVRELLELAQVDINDFYKEAVTYYNDDDLLQTALEVLDYV